MEWVIKNGRTYSNYNKENINATNCDYRNMDYLMV